jgi:hypothetical protein
VLPLLSPTSRERGDIRAPPPPLFPRSPTGPWLLRPCPPVLRLNASDDIPGDTLQLSHRLMATFRRLRRSHGRIRK